MLNSYQRHVRLFHKQNPDVKGKEIFKKAAEAWRRTRMTMGYRGVSFKEYFGDGVSVSREEGKDQYNYVITYMLEKPYTIVMKKKSKNRYLPDIVVEKNGHLFNSVGKGEWSKTIGLPVVFDLFLQDLDVFKEYKIVNEEAFARHFDEGKERWLEYQMIVATDEEKKLLKKIYNLPRSMFLKKVKEIEKKQHANLIMNQKPIDYKPSKAFLRSRHLSMNH